MVNVAIDVLDARMARREERDLVVDRVDPQQRGGADPVADPRRQQSGPEGLVAARVQRPKSDVAEAAELYRAGASLKELGEKYGVNDETVRVRLREVGVETGRRSSGT